MSGLPVRYRVRLAFGTYPKGFEFMSPPLSRAYAQTLMGRGFLEEIKEDVQTKVAEQAHKTLSPFIANRRKDLVSDLKKK